MDTSRFNDVQGRLGELRHQIKSKPDTDIRDEVLELIEIVSELCSATADKLPEAAEHGRYGR